MVYIVSFLTFLAVVMLGFYIIERKRIAAISLAMRLGIEQFEDLTGEQIPNPLPKLWGSLRQRLGTVLPGVAVDEYNHKLEMSGNPLNMKGEEFYLLKGVLCVLPPIMIPVVLLLGSGRMMVLMLVALSVGMYFLPDVWLSSRIEDRKRKIVRELYSFIDVLAISSDAGLNLSEAIKQTVEHQSGVVGKEFQQFLRDVDTGASRSEALEDVALRNDVEELDNLVLAINQAEKYGTPIAKMLREQVRVMREERRNRAQENAQKASVKILLPMIVFDFVPLLVVLLGPAIINLGQALGM